MDSHMFAQFLLGIERLATAGPRTGTGRVWARVQQPMPSQIYSPLKARTTSRPIATEVLTILVRSHMLCQLLVIIEGLLTARPTALERPVPGMPELVLLQVVPVLRTELTAVPIAVMID